MNNGIRQIAFYGKGGIGKSTIASNVAAALADSGLRTMLIGCDPKSDCTRNLRGDVNIPTVLEVLREKSTEKLELTELRDGIKQIDLDEIVYKGYSGVLCVEAGGPEPAVGCAGRGVIVVVDLLKKLGLYDSNLDVIIYDVLGDVVCGGFGMPLRRGLADDVFIVTSADFLSIYAANNICKGISRFAGRGGSPLGGIVYNVRGAIDDLTFVEEFAQSIDSKVIGAIPSDPTIMESEIYAKTVIEHKPVSNIADIFRDIAMRIYENKKTVSPKPLSPEELSKRAQRIRQKIRDEYLKG